MPSLIQQRMAIDRQRQLGTMNLILGTVFFVLGITQLALGGGAHWFSYGYLAVGLLDFALGVRTRRKATFARREFEAENGEDAGRQ